MTDVVVQSLQAAKRTRIKCSEYVKHIAVFGTSIAVLTSAAITVYDWGADDSQACQVHSRIPNPPPCQLLVIGSEHVVLAQNRRLRCYDLHGAQCALPAAYFAKDR